MTQRGPRRSLPRRLRAVAHGLAFGAVLYGSLLLCVVAAMPFLWHPRPTRAIVRFVARGTVPLALWAGGVRPEIRGDVARPDLAGGYVLIANHSSNLDPLLLMQLVGRPDLAFVAKAETLRRPALGHMVRSIGWIGVERDSLVALKKFREEVEARRRTGWIPDLVVFPEGTRSIDGALQKFRIGPFMLAVQTGLPVLPVVLRGARLRHPRHAFAVDPGRVRVDVGEPIFPPAGKVKAAQLVDAAEAMMRRAEAVFRAAGDLDDVAHELDLARFAAVAPARDALPEAS